MSLRHIGPHVVNAMEMEYHRHPFGEERQGMQAVTIPLPQAFDSVKQLDYVDRQDENPVYIGFAEVPFTSDSDTWIIQKLTYDSSSRVIKIDVAKGAWSDRASLF